MTYLASSVLGFMIFVQRATWHTHSHSHGGSPDRKEPHILALSSATETVSWLYKAGSFHMRPPVYAQAEVAKSRSALENKALLGYIYFA